MIDARPTGRQQDKLREELTLAKIDHHIEQPWRSPLTRRWPES
jgi:hypothetical protein